MWACAENNLKVAHPILLNYTVRCARYCEQLRLAILHFDDLLDSRQPGDGSSTGVGTERAAKDRALLDRLSAHPEPAVMSATRTCQCEKLNAAKMRITSLRRSALAPSKVSVGRGAF